MYVKSNKVQSKINKEVEAKGSNRQKKIIIRHSEIGHHIASYVFCFNVLFHLFLFSLVDYRFYVCAQELRYYFHNDVHPCLSFTTCCCDKIPGQSNLRNLRKKKSLFDSQLQITASYCGEDCRNLKHLVILMTTAKSIKQSIHASMLVLSMFPTIQNFLRREWCHPQWTNPPTSL